MNRFSSSQDECNHLPHAWLRLYSFLQIFCSCFVTEPGLSSAAPGQESPRWASRGWVAVNRAILRMKHLWVPHSCEARGEVNADATVLGMQERENPLILK